MKLLSVRYGGLPAFKMIAAAGPTSVSVAMTLPNSPAAHRQWMADAYAPARCPSAWDDTFHFSTPKSHRQSRQPFRTLVGAQNQWVRLVRALELGNILANIFLPRLSLNLLYSRT
jgi:hypothetical protein